MEITKCFIGMDFSDSDLMEIIILAQDESGIEYRFMYTKPKGREQVPKYSGKLATVKNNEAKNCDNPPFDHHRIANQLIQDNKVRFLVLFDIKDTDYVDPSKFIN